MILQPVEVRFRFLGRRLPIPVFVPRAWPEPEVRNKVCRIHASLQDILRYWRFLGAA
jgi:hypothetical protein